MTTKSLAVAQYILDRCRESGDSAVTPMQLLKLVYIAHGHMLGEYGMPLLDEPIQAWQYGPVVNSVYQAVRHYGSAPVRMVCSHIDVNAFTPDERRTMDMVARDFGRIDGVTLSAATHKSGTPWATTWEWHGQNAIISNDLIEHFYRRNLSLPSYSSL